MFIFLPFKKRNFDTLPAMNVWLFWGAGMVETGDYGLLVQKTWRGVTSFPHKF